MPPKINVPVTPAPRDVIHAVQKGAEVNFTATEDCTLYFHDASMFGTKKETLTANVPFTGIVKVNNGNTTFWAVRPASAATGAPSTTTGTTTSSTTTGTPARPLSNPNEIVVP